MQHIYTLFSQCSLSFRSKFTGLASSASNCNGTARNVNAFGIFLLAWLLAAGAFQSPLPPHVANLEKEAKKKGKPRLTGVFLATYSIQVSFSVFRLWKAPQKRAQKKYLLDVAWRLVTLVLHLNGKATKLCEVLFYAFGFLSLGKWKTKSTQNNCNQSRPFPGWMSNVEYWLLNVECPSI